MSGQNDYRIAAVDRALVVMEALAEQPDQGVTDIASRLGLTKSIVFRILQTLEARGFASRDPDRATWSLGYRLTVLGERAGHTKGLYQAARPVMRLLRDRTNETVNLVVRDGEQSLVVATHEGRHLMRLFAQTGRYGPLHAGGSSVVLLAFAPEEIREAVLSGPLTSYTAHTMTDPDQLRQRLERIRNRGWHIAQSDLDEGAFSVSAPIRGADDNVVAAISIAGPIARFDEDRRDDYLSAVEDAARDVSRRLGLGPMAGTGEQAA